MFVIHVFAHICTQNTMSGYSLSSSFYFFGGPTFCYCFCPIFTFFSLYCVLRLGFCFYTFTLYGKMNLDPFFEGCTPIIHAHMHSVCGSSGTIRLFIFNLSCSILLFQLLISIKRQTLQPFWVICPFPFLGFFFLLTKVDEY